MSEAPGKTRYRRRRLVVTIDEDVVPGTEVCLVRWWDGLPRDRGNDPTSGWHLTSDPRTLGSDLTCWNGWLGAWNDRHQEARGRWRVVSLQPYEHPWNSSYEEAYRASLVWVADE
ncbi:hypothetical protein [Aeromicrobium marinum]|nr:hypothetical protein [Aeromicrobium marinum]